MRQPPIPLTFCGGMNNVNTPLELFARKQGETPLLVNADTRLLGRLKLLRPFKPISGAAGAGIHTIHRANDVILIGAGASIKRLKAVTFTDILTGLTSGAKVSIAHAGNWVYFGNGHEKRAIYLPEPIGTDWGQEPPSDAPTVTSTSVLDLTDGVTYKWTASGGGVNEYYCELIGGGDPSLDYPDAIQIDGSVATEGTVGSLAAEEWGYGDGDALGYSTVYVRLAGGGDPDAEAVGYILASDSEYSCYYRYKITLPDDSVIYTDLSPVVTVRTFGAFTISWSGLVHADFLGATNNQIELFRFKTGFAAIYLVTTLDSGTTTYSDTIDDDTLQDSTEFAETGYYPPPDSINLAIYHPGCDRVFAVVGNNIYWSEAGLYHSFVYDIVAGVYTNANSVFLSGENVTGLALWDQQLYIGSERTWRRLRGNDPAYWQWENTSARKGPMSTRSAVETPWGILYPGNDGYLWLFNGNSAMRVLEYFAFDTKPDSDSHATFDGRFYRLYYGDPTYPEIVADFYGFPAATPRIVPSTRSASCSHYDQRHHELYIGTSDGYVKNGEDMAAEVTMTFRIPEVPVEQLAVLGDVGSLLIHANTQEADLTITPYLDDEAESALTAVSTNRLRRKVLPLPLNPKRSVWFEVSITSSKDIELREPWLLKREDDSGY